MPNRTRQNSIAERSSGGGGERVSAAQFAGCRSGPAPTRRTERTLVRVPQKEGDLSQLEILLAQIFIGESMSQAIENCGERGIELAQPAYQSSLAHAEFRRNDLGASFASG